MIRVTLKAKKVQSLVMRGFLLWTRWGTARGLASKSLVTNDNIDINWESPVCSRIRVFNGVDIVP
jgi:hypothetical protein